MQKNNESRIADQRVVHNVASTNAATTAEKPVENGKLNSHLCFANFLCKMYATCRLR